MLLKDLQVHKINPNILVATEQMFSIFPPNYLSILCSCEAGDNFFVIGNTEQSAEFSNILFLTLKCIVHWVQILILWYTRHCSKYTITWSVFTVSRLMFGKELRLPGDWMFGSPPGPERVKWRTAITIDSNSNLWQRSNYIS